VVLIGCFLLIGFIVWLDKAPDMMAQCAGVAKTAVVESLQGIAESAGVPAG